MTAQATWPPPKSPPPPPPDDGDEAGNYEYEYDYAESQYGPAYAVIAELAGLLRDTRASVIADGSVLGLVALGFGLDARLGGHLLRHGLAGFVDLVVLVAVLACWLTAGLLVARASTPTVGVLNELRWVTGAPVDPRPPWLTLPPVGADPAQWTWHRAYLLVGAARLARYRMQFADTWTYLAAGCFLLWIALPFLHL